MKRKQKKEAKKLARRSSLSTVFDACVGLATGLYLQQPLCVSSGPFSHEEATRILQQAEAQADKTQDGEPHAVWAHNGMHGWTRLHLRFTPSDSALSEVPRHGCTNHNHSEITARGQGEPCILDATQSHRKATPAQSSHDSYALRLARTVRVA